MVKAASAGGSHKLSTGSDSEYHDSSTVLIVKPYRGPLARAPHFTGVGRKAQRPEAIRLRTHSISGWGAVRIQVCWWPFSSDMGDRFESNPTSIFLDKVFQLWALACLCGLWGKAVSLSTGRLGTRVRFNKASCSVFDTKESLNTRLFWSHCFLSSAPKLLHLVRLLSFFF